MKRLHAILLGSGIILIGLFAAFVLSAQKTPTKMKGNSGDRQNISMVTVETEATPLQFRAGGRVTSSNRIDIFAEVSGVLQSTAVPFKEGRYFRRGDTLIRIDGGVYRNNLIAQKSSLLNQLTQVMPDVHMEFPSEAGKWERYLSAFSLEQELASLPKSSGEKETYFLAARNIYNLYYSVKSMEATMAKYTLTAPFNGVVAQSMLNPGTLVRNGQQLGVFVNTDRYEVALPMSIENVQLLRVGMTAKLQANGIDGTLSGIVSRINPVVEQSTQTATVYLEVSDARLSDGMYVTAVLEAKESTIAAKIPRTAVDNGGFAYVTSDAGLEQRPVLTISELGEQLVVQGLANGDIILRNSEDAAEYRSAKSGRVKEG